MIRLCSWVSKWFLYTMYSTLLFYIVISDTYGVYPIGWVYPKMKFTGILEWTRAGELSFFQKIFLKYVFLKIFGLPPVAISKDSFTDCPGGNLSANRIAFYKWYIAITLYGRYTSYSDCTYHCIELWQSALYLYTPYTMRLSCGLVAIWVYVSMQESCQTIKNIQLFLWPIKIILDFYTKVCYSGVKIVRIATGGNLD